MGWNGTYIDGINTKIAGSATGSIQQALGSSSTSQIALFNLEKSKDDRWAKYRPVVSVTDRAGNPIVSINAYAGGTINAYGGTGTTPGYIGNMREYSRTVSGASRKYVTFCGLDVPIVESASRTSSGSYPGVEDIFARTGQADYNWSKTICTLPSEAGTYRRALDFNGYKPLATFPLEYAQTGQEIDPRTSTMYAAGRHADAASLDSLRLFVGDLAKYYFDDRLVWAAAVARIHSGNTTYYPLIYQDENGHTLKMSDVASEYSMINGWALLPVPSSYYRDHNGDTLKVCIFGYDPTNDVAVLLPSAGGSTTTNPTIYTIAQSSVTDVLSLLSFNLENEKWGRAYSTTTESFPTGYLGYTLTEGTGIYAYGTYTSFMFSITFTNRTGSSLVLNLGRLAFDVGIYGYSSGDYYQVKTTTRRNATYYDSTGTVIPSGSYSKTISNNSSLKIYVYFSNLWEGLNSSYIIQSGSYVNLMGVNIVNLDFPTKSYTGGGAMFFAKYENQGQTWKFNWAWDGSGPKK